MKERKYISNLFSVNSVKKKYKCNVTEKRAVALREHIQDLVEFYPETILYLVYSILIATARFISGKEKQRQNTLFFRRLP